MIDVCDLFKNVTIIFRTAIIIIFLSSKIVIPITRIIKNTNIDKVMSEHRISEIYEIAVDEKTNQRKYEN